MQKIRKIFKKQLQKYYW